MPALSAGRAAGDVADVGALVDLDRFAVELRLVDVDGLDAEHARAAGLRAASMITFAFEIGMAKPTFCALARIGDGGVDADHPTLRVDERAAGVARG